MVRIDTNEELRSWPDRVMIIGGGRWARVLIDVLCSLVPASVAISVHSRHNVGSISTWAEERGLGQRIECSSAWPQSDSLRSCAVIVVNAARDHREAVEWALAAGFATMVEKPIALTFAAAQHLAELACDRKVRLAAAHVFLFATYLENFSKIIANAGRVESLHIDWTDPRSEDRYGEPKRYDASLPVFSDWLPHVIPIAETLLSGLPDRCRRLDVRRGGAAIELELIAGNASCTVRMERNADLRRRLIQASAGGEMFSLDFSIEPGTIGRGSSTATTSGDQDWHSGRRPVARMLTAFLTWAAGGERDWRLDIGPGLQACRVIDQTSALYLSMLMPWLVARLSAAVPVDADLRYALAELLQAEGPLSAADLERQVNKVTTLFSGMGRAKWSRELNCAPDAARLLRTIAA